MIGYGRCMEIPAGYAQITLGFSGAMAPTGAAVVYGVLWDEEFPSSFMSEALDEAVAAFGTRFMPAITNQLTLSSALIKVGPNVTGPSLEKGYSVTGGSGNVGGYPGACYLLTKRTAFGGRAGRGRMFLPGVPEATIEPGGLLTSGTATAMTTAATNWLADHATNAVPVVLLHNAGSPLTEPTPVTEMACSARTATQRRRNRR